MYKTVRHGENSLQYTILPQTEEVLNNSGLKGKGRDYSPSIHARRTRKISTFRYGVLISSAIVISLAIATVALIVWSYDDQAVHLPSVRKIQANHEIITNSPLTPMGREMAKSRKKELQIAPDLLMTVLPKIETSSPASSTLPPPPRSRAPLLLRTTTTASTTTVQPLPTVDLEKIPLIDPSSDDNRYLHRYVTAKTWEENTVKSTVTPEPTTLRDIVKHYYLGYVPTTRPVTTTRVFEDVLITSSSTTTPPPPTTDSNSVRSRMEDIKDTILSADDDEDFKEMEVDVRGVFPLPPLKPEDSDEVTVSKAGDAGWYGARWPIIDPSSYFQWTGYSQDDNFLLPLLLMAALTSVTLVLVIALVVRRHKRSLSANQQIGLTADLQADDNTNLLTAENPEDGDE